MTPCKRESKRLSYSSIVVARTNWCKVWYSLVNIIRKYRSPPPGFHYVACKKQPFFTVIRISDKIRVRIPTWIIVILQMNTILTKKDLFMNLAPGLTKYYADVQLSHRSSNTVIMTQLNTWSATRVITIT